MDVLTEALSALLAGLSMILTVIAALAAYRYRDGRLASVAAALALFAVIGGLSLLHEFSPRYGGGYTVDAVPLGLAVIAVALLYLALVQRRSTTRSGHNG